MSTVQLVCTLQGRSKLDNWGGADIHIYVFTHHKNNLICAEHDYMNISPPPNYQACQGQGAYKHPARALHSPAVHTGKRQNADPKSADYFCGQSP